VSTEAKGDCVKHRNKLLSLSLITVMLFTACGSDQINRAVNIISDVRPLVQSFHLSPTVERDTLLVMDEGKAALIVFRDSPTVGNLRNAITVFQGLADRIKTGNPATDARLKAIIATVVIILSLIQPPPTGDGVARDGAKIVLTDEQQKAVKVEIDRLEKLVKH
jgi:hypothetical protein